MRPRKKDETGEPDPGDLLGIDGLVARYRAAYPEGDPRRNWIEALLRRWVSQREVSDAKPEDRSETDGKPGH